jgi:translation elongation factor EF-1alpha
MMYAHCGACQAILYVIPCGDIEQVKTKLRQDLITYHALTSNVEWIFVINKMDLVQYNEQEFNKCVSSIKKVAVKVIGEHRMDRLHFIPMSASDMSTRVTGDSSAANMTWHNKDVNLWSVLNRVAEESAPSPLKMFKKFKATVVKTFTGGLNDHDTEYRMSVYVMEGCISVGEDCQILPNGIMKSLNYFMFQSYNWNTDHRQHSKILGIQSYGLNKKFALPNSYVGISMPKFNPGHGHLLPKYHIIHYPITLPFLRSSCYSLNKWQQNPVYDAVILHVGKQNSRYKWNGMIQEGYTAAIHTLGIRSGIKIEKISAIYDKNGTRLDLEEVIKERKVLALKKGEKAEVILKSDFPLNVTIRDPNNDVFGRFVIQTQRNHVVAVGTITNIPEYLFQNWD